MSTTESLSSSPITWTSNSEFKVGDVLFRSGTKYADDQDVLVLKTKSLIEYYVGMLDRFPKPNIIELGIAHGGSTVLFSELFKPKNLVAVDKRDIAKPFLHRYLETKDNIECIFGADQKNLQGVMPRLSKAMDPLDLVIDDASHFYEETKGSFNTLFPLIREGGLYIIEDWGWAHWSGMWQGSEAPWQNQPSLANLLFEIVMASAAHPRLIRSVTINNAVASVERGDQEVESMDLSSMYMARGKRVQLI